MRVTDYTMAKAYHSDGTKRLVVLSKDDRDWLDETFDRVVGPTPEFTEDILSMAHAQINHLFDKYQWLSSRRLLADVMMSFHEHRNTGDVIPVLFLAACCRVFYDIWMGYGWTRENLMGTIEDLRAKIKQQQARK
ncbi:hypothetical protein QBC41DRAFT_333831 [Cercophora samala]|uniref:Uncharacterized protein n=1 Tax=Cercophora samala TaxID=330535 RepID=A0AA39ZLG3_9PEZI|nr:hypothetical protein QBC41DRAFT_333831 [Cercophora samala]